MCLPRDRESFEAGGDTLVVPGEALGLIAGVLELGREGVGIGGNGAEDSEELVGVVAVGHLIFIDQAVGILADRRLDVQLEILNIEIED